MKTKIDKKELDSKEQKIEFLKGELKYCKKKLDWCENRITEKEQKIEEVLSMPAVSIAGMDCYQILINRTLEGITWNESAVRDLMMTTDHFYFLPSLVWKRTVKETHWFDEMSNEDIVNGKWKNLM